MQIHNEDEFLEALEELVDEAITRAGMSKFDIGSLLADKGEDLKDQHLYDGGA